MLDLVLQIAAALSHGALTDRDVPPDLFPVIEPRLAFSRATTTARMTLARRP